MSETQNLSQALIDAMSIIVDYNNSRLSKDETVECEIIRKKDVETGEFIVRYLNGTFSAFAASSDLANNLEIGDMAYVLIPQGDTSERKTITAKTGRISSQRLNDITLDIERINTSNIPFNSLYNFKNYNPNEPLGIYGSRDYISLKYEAEIDVQKDKIFQNYAHGNTVLFISGKFKTDWYWASAYINKGDYGINVVFERLDGTEVICKLNRNAMAGDSLNYNLIDGYENYVLLKIDGASLKRIKYIEFYAEKFDRTDLTDEALQEKYENGDFELFLKDLRIEFVEYADMDGYFSYITTPQTNSFDDKEEISLIANLKFNGQPVEQFEKTAKIYWFEQDASININSDYYSEYGGQGWRKLNNETAQLILKKSDFEERLVLKKFYKVVILYNEYKLIAKKEIYYRIDDMSKFKINLELSADGRSGDLIVEPNWEAQGYSTKWQSEDINGILESEESNENFVLRNIDIANIYGSKDYTCTIYFQNEPVYFLTRTVYNTSNLQDVVVKFITDDNGIYYYDENGNYLKDTRKNITFTLDIKQEEGSNDLYHWSYEWGYPENINPDNLMFNIISDEDAMQGDDTTSNRTLSYVIDSSFKANKTEDNVIQLKIIIGDKEYYFYKELNFTKEGDQGTNGSSLVMKVDIVGSNRAILANGQLSTLDFEIEMTKDGETTFQGKKIVDYFSFSVSVPMDYKLENPLYDIFELNEISLQDNRVSIAFPAISGLAYKNAVIQFKATPNQGGETLFPYSVTYLMPIALTVDSTYQTYEYLGPTVVQYDERGYNGKWDNSLLKLVDYEGKDTGLEFEPYGSLFLSETKETINPPSYFDPNNLVLGVQTTNEVYVQPIIGTLNAFSKAILNAWDGASIEINEEGNYVLASQVGAGVKTIKDDKNVFTGVLMGQLSNRQDSNDENYGLLGFYEGQSTFGFLANGSGYIGASGKGRIEFNPRTGSAIIQSGDFIKDEAGMQINLSEGYINAASFSLESSGLTIVSDGSLNQGTRRNLFSFDIANVNGDTGYFKVYNGDADMIYLSGARQYIQSSNYYTSDGEKGIYIDLNNGSLQSPKFFIDSSGNASFKGSINVNNKFIVDGSTGNVSILGNLTLSDGAISWSDLGTDVKNEINNLVPTLPSYIKSTYIDATTIQSPTIVGGSLTSTSGIKTATLTDSKLTFRCEGSYDYDVGYIQAYDNGAGTATEAGHGLLIQGTWNGDGFNGGVKIQSSQYAGISLSAGKDIWFYINNGATVVSLSDLIANSGGGTAVFG